MSNREAIDNFSEFLFWDVDRYSVDIQKNEPFLVQRVLEYGLIEDWNALKRLYGVPRIARTAQKLRSLDPRALSFIAAISSTPIEQFRCYTTRPLMQIR